MNTKIKFLGRLIVLILLATFSGCNEELYEITDHHNGLDKNKISLNQFKNETNISKVQPVLSVSTTKSITAKTKTQLSDFVIDTLAIKKFINENNNTTYTFRIYPLFEIIQPNDIYNLVYHKVDNNWETAIFYLKKLPEENGEHNLFEKIERIYDGKVINGTSSKIANLEMCAIETKSIQCNGSCKAKCDGYTCSTGECIQRSITFMLCSIGSGGGSTSGGSVTTGGGGAFGGGTVYGGGGTSSNGSYSYSPHYINNPAFEYPKYINELNTTYTKNSLSKELKDFFNTRANNKYFNETIQYQINNKWSSESKKIADWARNYKIQHPNTTWEQFKNWFATPIEGKDTEYNPAFWDNPNLTFPKQNLPTRLNYLAGMPKFANGDLMTGADNVYNLVGGLVLAARVANRARTENTCALKTSIALNRSGIIIPNIPGETIEGAGPEFAGKYFFLNAKKLNVWMRETFGTNPANTKTPYNAKHLSLTATDGGLKGKNFPTLPVLQNVSGIYSLVFKNNEASGHADYIYTDFDGKIRCPFGCFFNYEFERMDIWILD